MTSLGQDLSASALVRNERSRLNRFRSALEELPPRVSAHGSFHRAEPMGFVSYRFLFISKHFPKGKKGYPSSSALSSGAKPHSIGVFAMPFRRDGSGVPGHLAYGRWPLLRV